MIALLAYCHQAFAVDPQQEFKPDAPTLEYVFNQFSLGAIPQDSEQVKAFEFYILARFNYPDEILNWDEARSSLLTILTKTDLPPQKELPHVLIESEGQTYQLRHLSVAEKGFVSCAGGHCTSRADFEQLYEPALHSFTLTGKDGISQGSIGVALGRARNPKQSKSANWINVAMIDDIQDVEPKFVPIVIEALRQVLVAQGYRLGVPSVITYQGFSNSHGICEEVKNILHSDLAQGQVFSFLPEIGPYFSEPERIEIWRRQPLTLLGEGDVQTARLTIQPSDRAPPLPRFTFQAFLGELQSYAATLTQPNQQLYLVRSLHALFLDPTLPKQGFPESFDAWVMDVHNQHRDVSKNPDKAMPLEEKLVRRTKIKIRREALGYFLAREKLERVTEIARASEESPTLESEWISALIYHLENSTPHVVRATHKWINSHADWFVDRHRAGKNWISQILKADVSVDVGAFRKAVFESRFRFEIVWEVLLKSKLKPHSPVEPRLLRSLFLDQFHWLPRSQQVLVQRVISGDTISTMGELVAVCAGMNDSWPQTWWEPYVRKALSAVPLGENYVERLADSALEFVIYFPKEVRASALSFAFSEVEKSSNPLNDQTYEQVVSAVLEKIEKIVSSSDLDRIEKEKILRDFLGKALSNPHPKRGRVWNRLAKSVMDLPDHSFHLLVNRLGDRILPLPIPDGQADALLAIRVIRRAIPLMSNQVQDRASLLRAASGLWVGQGLEVKKELLQLLWGLEETDLLGRVAKDPHFWLDGQMEDVFFETLQARLMDPETMQSSLRWIDQHHDWIMERLIQRPEMGHHFFKPMDKVVQLEIISTLLWKTLISGETYVGSDLKTLVLLFAAVLPEGLAYSSFQKLARAVFDAADPSLQESFANRVYQAHVDLMNLTKKPSQITVQRTNFATAALSVLGEIGAKTHAKLIAHSLASAHVEQSIWFENLWKIYLQNEHFWEDQHRLSFAVSILRQVRQVPVAIREYITEHFAHKTQHQWLSAIESTDLSSAEDIRLLLQNLGLVQVADLVSASDLRSLWRHRLEAHPFVELVLLGDMARRDNDLKALDALLLAVELGYATEPDRVGVFESKVFPRDRTSWPVGDLDVTPTKLSLIKNAIKEEFRTLIGGQGFLTALDIEQVFSQVSKDQVTQPKVRKYLLGLKDVLVGFDFEYRISALAEILPIIDSLPEAQRAISLERIATGVSRTKRKNEKSRAVVDRLWLRIGNASSRVSKETRQSLSERIQKLTAESGSALAIQPKTRAEQVSTAINPTAPEEVQPLQAPMRPKPSPTLTPMTPEQLVTYTDQLLRSPTSIADIDAVFASPEKIEAIKKALDQVQRMSPGPEKIKLQKRLSKNLGLIAQKIDAHLKKAATSTGHVAPLTHGGQFFVSLFVVHFIRCVEELEFESLIDFFVGLPQEVLRYFTFSASAAVTGVAFDLTAAVYSSIRKAYFLGGQHSLEYALAHPVFRAQPASSKAPVWSPRVARFIARNQLAFIAGLIVNKLLFEKYDSNTFWSDIYRLATSFMQAQFVVRMTKKAVVNQVRRNVLYGARKKVPAMVQIWSKHGRLLRMVHLETGGAGLVVGAVLLASELYFSQEIEEWNIYTSGLQKAQLSLALSMGRFEQYLFGKPIPTWPSSMLGRSDPCGTVKTDSVDEAFLGICLKNNLAQEVLHYQNVVHLYPLAKAYRKQLNREQSLLGRYQYMILPLAEFNGERGLWVADTADAKDPSLRAFRSEAVNAYQNQYMPELQAAFVSIHQDLEKLRDLHSKVERLRSKIPPLEAVCQTKDQLTNFDLFLKCKGQSIAYGFTLRNLVRDEFFTPALRDQLKGMQPWLTYFSRRQFEVSKGGTPEKMFDVHFPIDSSSLVQSLLLWTANHRWEKSYFALSSSAQMIFENWMLELTTILEESTSPSSFEIGGQEQSLFSEINTVHYSDRPHIAPAAFPKGLEPLLMYFDHYDDQGAFYTWNDLAHSPEIKVGQIQRYSVYVTDPDLDHAGPRLLTQLVDKSRAIMIPSNKDNVAYAYQAISDLLWSETVQNVTDGPEGNNEERVQKLSSARFQIEPSPSGWIQGRTEWVLRLDVGGLSIAKTISQDPQIDLLAEQNPASRVLSVPDYDRYLQDTFRIYQVFETIDPSDLPLLESKIARPVKTVRLPQGIAAAMEDLIRQVE